MLSTIGAFAHEAGHGMPFPLIANAFGVALWSIDGRVTVLGGYPQRRDRV